MRLNRIELYGFKSFADRVSLDLTSGLTAVVGPNGCGKSNIIDAIKWTLGEQRPAALRGDEMMDVVFKGNGARPARNFAEVSLVFDNSDGRLPIEYGEVVITRRLFRSGDSEYLINRNNVRLKDIRNLLMDTGLGTSAYAIMEQGRIDAILSANPADRRRIFEEAAGISRYRSQRRESESKLGRTQQNLLRLGDVIEELERRSRSLKQQAGRARSYREAQERVAELRGLYYAHRWAELGRSIDASQGRVEQGEDGERQARDELQGARGEWAALQDQGSLRHRELDEVAEAFRDVTVQVEGLVERTAAVRGRLSGAAQRQQRLEQDVREQRLALEARREESLALGGRLEAVQAEQADAAEAEQRARQQLTGVEARLQAWREQAEQRRAAALERVAEWTDCRNAVAGDTSRLDELRSSRDRLATRLAALRDKLAQHETLRAELDHGAREMDARHSDASELQARWREKCDQLALALARADEQQAARREALAAAASRRAALAELIERREGVSPGAIELLDSGLPGVEGLVVDQFRAPAGLAEALEAALGAVHQAVVMTTRDQAGAALDLLHERGAGRVQLLARDTLRPREGAPGGDPLLGHVEVLARADVAEALLGHVRLVPDRQALLSCRVDGVTVFVTPDGDVLDERGVLRGGSTQADGGLVARRTECDTLGRRVEQLTAEAEQAGAQREQLAREREAVEAELRDADGRLRAVDADRGHARARSEQMADQVVSLARDLELDEQDHARLERESTTLEQALQAAASREQELSRRVDADRLAEDEAEALRADLERSAERRRARFSEVQVTLSTLAERAEALVNERQQVDRGAAEREEAARRASAEIEELSREQRELQAELQALRARDAELGEERDRCAGQHADARRCSGELDQRLGEAQARVTACEERLEAASRAAAEARMQLQETRIHRDNLAGRVRDELDLDFEQQPPADADDGETDWDGVEAEIEQLRTRMARAGTVNLGAVEELEEVSGRLAYLTAQRDDLLAARRSIEETIGALNRESRERFVRTFEEVRGHFRGIFRKLFRGGKADVRLQEGVDVLEAGVEILAAPPGKDARSISLLSGGERTLTAVGLLFALFRTRPSPVCLLDEVDAALDETNIDRFCSVLEDFLGSSQFLVVTHARRTMSYADTLYGITMQEHGVSRALSLSVSEYVERNGRVEAAVDANGSPQLRAVEDGQAPADRIQPGWEEHAAPAPQRDAVLDAVSRTTSDGEAVDRCAGETADS